MSSYYVYARAAEGKLLLGGCKQMVTSRFSTRELAKDREFSIRYHNPGVHTEIHESENWPEIFEHCGKDNIVVIGGYCQGCKQLMRPMHTGWRKP